MCTFQYRPHCENRTTVTVKCIRTCIFLFLFDVEIQGRVLIKTHVFFDFTDFQVPVYPFAATTSSTTNGGKSGEEGVMVPPLAIHLSSTMGSTGTSHKKDATRYVKSVFIVHVGGTRCVPSSTDNIMKRHARITWTVEVIRTCIFLFLLYV